jgi:ABC-type metal ion transport system, periplasmic component/surface adhesin
MTVLMPIGADPHDFQASSAQVALMAGADLVVVNGLGLEEGVLDAVENVEADGVSVLEIASLVDPLPFGGDHGG